MDPRCGCLCARIFLEISHRKDLQFFGFSEEVLIGLVTTILILALAVITGRTRNRIVIGYYHSILLPLCTWLISFIRIVYPNDNPATQIIQGQLDSNLSSTSAAVTGITKSLELYNYRNDYLARRDSDCKYKYSTQFCSGKLSLSPDYTTHPLKKLFLSSLSTVTTHLLGLSID